MSSEETAISVGALLHHAWDQAHGETPSRNLTVMALNEHRMPGAGSLMYSAVVVYSADGYYSTGERLLVYAQDIGSVWMVL